MATNEDPVASKSAFLCTYMGNHPETLLAYIIQKDGPTARTATDTKMDSISSREMVLSYALAGEKRRCVVPFDPVLAGFEEVRPRLLSMKQEAEGEIGMAEKPAITSFSFPSNFWISGLMIGFLIYTSIPLNSPYFSRQALEPAAMVRNATGGWKTIKAAWIFTIIVHALEAAYQWSRCTRNQTPLMPKLAFTMTTFVFGFPGLLEFQRRVRQAKISSVKKQ